MKGHVPGDIEVTVAPGLGNRKYFSDPGENFIVIIRRCSECTVPYEEKGIMRQPVQGLGAIWHGSSFIDAWREGVYADLTALEPGHSTAFKVETTFKSNDAVSADIYITGYHPR